MASSQILKNANGNVVRLENPDTNFSNKTIDISKLEDNLGIGQTWQDVTASRAYGVTYTNTSGKPIVIAPGWINIETSGAVGIEVVINGLTFNNIYPGASLAALFAAANPCYIVQPGGTYSVTGISSNLFSWYELRD